MSDKNRALSVSDEVRHALDTGAPVVAFESTVMTHGLPYPTSFELATAMERIARDAGCVPATIGVVEGTIHVGLSRADLERLARMGGGAAKAGAHGGVAKASSFDLPFILATGRGAGTTVSGTLAACDMVGINVFATGGIGGVHRDATSTFDVSHDLPSIAGARAITVCAGAKAILDLPKTLEYLETMGACVIGYRTKRFPAFYSRDSGLDLDYHTDSPDDVAKAFCLREELGLRGGMLVVTPVPSEREIPAADMEGAIQLAVAEAAKRGVRGKAITPFILERLSYITEGRSVECNLALLENNAMVAAEIAIAISRQRSARN
jgi:pseudouridine-5'-phosphate glycosidase